MVAPDGSGVDGHGTGRESTADRGQLLLIGAVGVAFIIVGLAVVVNSMVLADAGGADGPRTESEDVALINHEVQRDTRSLVVHTNHYEVYDTPGALDASLRENVTEYSDLLGATHADSSGAFVNVSFAGRNETGTRIVQADDGEFTSPSPAGSDNYTLIGPDGPGTTNQLGVTSAGQLGWFVMNVNASETSDRTKPWFNVTIVGDDGEYVTLYMNQNATGEGVSSALDVESDVSTTAGSDGNVTCISSGDRVLIDVVAGRCVNDEGKLFRTVDDLERPYRIRFRNGSEGVGKYAIVTDVQSGSGYNCPATGPDPCRAPAAWSVDVSVTYRTEAVAYRNVQSVTVYNETN
jgi:hypothetical protein